jgi:hypothetical protein
MFVEIDKKWETYEQVARYLLDLFSWDLALDRVEGKQIIPGKLSGANWEIDAKGVRTKDEEFIIVECMSIGEMRSI